ncbi:MAG: hypothetical protein WBL68_15240 [Nitrososphaeraceae archaeon]
MNKSNDEETTIEGKADKDLGSNSEKELFDKIDKKADKDLGSNSEKELFDKIDKKKDERAS